MRISQRTFNIIAGLIIGLQLLAESLLTNPLPFLSPDAHKWIIVAITGVVIVFNGVKSYFKESPLILVNIILFIGYLAGGVVELLDLLPDLETSTRIAILSVTGLIATIVNYATRFIATLQSQINSNP